MAVALAAVILAYANSFDNAFHFDDFHTITDNPAVRSLGNARRFFCDATSFSVLPANRTYRPVVSLSLAVDYALGRGYTPFWFHLSTFCWFVSLLGLLWMMYRRMLARTGAAERAPWLALIAAAWFGLHPAMAETVNYVIQRGDLYATLGCVASLTMWSLWPSRRRWGFYLLPLALAMLSKPPAAVFPILLFFWVFFFEAAEADRVGERLRRSALAALPSVSVVFAGLWLQSAMTPRTFAPSELSASAYRLTQPFVWLRYFGEFVVPVHLNVDTDLQAFPTLNGSAVLGLVFLGLLAAGIGFTARRRRLFPIAYGLLWFVVTQLPTSLYPLSEVENDHRMFFSFAGLTVATVWAAYLLLERLGLLRRPELAAGVAICVLALYGWGVHERNAVWHSEESLWQDDVEKSPHNGRGLMIYGLTQMSRGAYPEALARFEQALAYTPNYPTLEINLGVVNDAMGREDEARAHFDRAIALAPADDEAYAYEGRWLLSRGHPAEAVRQLRTAIALNPSRLMAHDLLLEALAAEGDKAAAVLAARDTLRVAPDDVAARRALSEANGSAEVRQLRPGTVNGWVQRSLELHQAGRFAESRDAAEEALKLDPRSAEAWNNVAAAEEALHHWDAAIEAAQRALAIRPEFQLARNNLAWSQEQRRLGVR